MILAVLLAVQAAPPSAIATVPAAIPVAPARRETWAIDQVRFPVPREGSALTTLAPLHSMAAIVAELARLGIAYDRSPVAVDTAALPPAVVDQVAILPAGEPFVIPQAGIVTINVIRTRTPR